MSNRDIVVIGGSAGATAPLRRILADLPADLAASVLVVRHMHADSTDGAILLAGAGPLPVRSARDGEEVERRTVYTAVPGHHLMLDGKTIRLTGGPRENMARPAVDPLFRSAAVSGGPRVVGVVLSGGLNDGASGLQAIARCGGVTIAQDPADADSPEMPRSALEAGAVDHREPAARIGALLTRLIGETAGEAVPVPPEIRLEVAMAAGRRTDSDSLLEIADPAPVSCPHCQGVLSEVRGPGPLRYRCQIGHAVTARVLDGEQDGSVQAALSVALRMLEERVQLLTRMARDARSRDHVRSAETYEARAAEYRHRADTVRRVVMEVLGMAATGGPPAASA